MFERLLEILSEVPPFVMIDEDEGAIRLRLGKYEKTLTPGFHWRIPLYHSVRRIPVRPQWMTLRPQTINSIVVEAMVQYDVEDPAKAMLNVLDFDDDIVELSMGSVGDYLISSQNPTAAELKAVLFEELAQEAEEWGLNILTVKISSFTKARAIRLIGDD